MVVVGASELTTFSVPCFLQSISAFHQVSKENYVDFFCGGEENQQNGCPRKNNVMSPIIISGTDTGLNG